MTTPNLRESAWKRSVREGKFVSAAAAVAVAVGGFFVDLNTPTSLRTLLGGLLGYVGSVAWGALQQRDEARKELQRLKKQMDAQEARRHQFLAMLQQAAEDGLKIARMDRMDWRDGLARAEGS